MGRMRAQRPRAERRADGTVRAVPQCGMALSLPPDKHKQLAASFKRYVVENLEPDAGDLKIAMLLDFCLKELGAIVYNQAIGDAQSYFQARVADLEGVCYEHEFTYWPRGRA